MGCHRSGGKDTRRRRRLRSRTPPCFAQIERLEWVRVDIKSRRQSWGTAREVEAWLRWHQSQWRSEDAFQSLLKIGYLWRQLGVSLGIEITKSLC
jgi:hypothetical protein